MKLHKIIETNDTENSFIAYETMQPYLKSLYVYYADEFREEPVLMVESIFNAVQYVKIVDVETFTMYLDTLSEDESEVIRFNSKMLGDLI